MDAGKWDLINEAIKANQFKLGALTSGTWKFTSSNLKRAADRLYDHCHDANVRNIKRMLNEADSGQIIDGCRELKGEELDDVLDGQLISVYLLLIGYAFENLLKGALMFEHPEYFKPDAKMTDIQSHSLTTICKRCNINLQPEEINLLEELTLYILWKGKYPIPLEAKNVQPILQSDGTARPNFLGYREDQMKEAVDTMYMKIWTELERRQESVRDSL